MAGCRDLKPQLKILLLRTSCRYVCISSNVVVVEMPCCANVKKNTKKQRKTNHILTPPCRACTGRLMQRNHLSQHPTVSYGVCGDGSLKYSCAGCWS